MPHSSNRGIKIFAALGAIVIVVVLLGAGYLFLLRGEATNSTNILFEGLSNIVYGPFAPNSIQDVQQISQGTTPSKYGESLLNLIPLLKSIPSRISDIQKFAGLMVQTEASLESLRSSGSAAFFRRQWK